MLTYLLDGPFLEGDYVFQHDNSAIHSSKKVKSFLQERGINVLECPPQSPGLNVVENVWGLLQSALAGRSLHGPSADNLWLFIEKEWETFKRNTSLTTAFYQSILIEWQLSWRHVVKALNIDDCPSV
ncbi:hypothetical protein MRX96_025714 [Rhipicephalus microplus]